MNRNPTVVFTEPGNVVMEDRDVPSPEAGQLLIKTHCTLISTGTELTILSGNFRAGSAWAGYGKFPFRPGYDNIGEVVGVGPGVDREWMGKRVATYGRHTLYFTTNTESIRPIQRDIPEEHAVFFTIAEIVMNGVRRSKLLWGESAVVFGLGLLGQLTVRFCRLAGARPVIGVDVADSRLEMLPQDVALFPANPEKDELVALVEKLTRSRMADVAFEVTGDPALIPGEFSVLRKQGRLVVLSSPRGKSEFDFHDLCNSPSFTIIGAHNGSHPRQATLDNPWTNQRDCELFFDLVADGEMDIEPLISHREPYTKAVELYGMLLEDRSQAMGVVLDWTL